VAAGAGVTSITGEPSVANDRNMLLFTGNAHAAVSSDNGITWQYINPADTDLWPNSDGGFCCDQVAYAVPRGGYALVLWLLQYRNDGATRPTDGTNGRLRLAVFQGRNELSQAGNLANEVIEQADFCTVDFKPSDFGFVTNSYFDRTPYVEQDESGRAVYVEHHRTVGDRVRDVVAAGSEADVDRAA
jgi:hypothetical protein